ncbi:sensor histidine kinase [Streptomyces sp. TP-A0874]|uniref:sensor histidine kinase n=1 Tax=Streptomyces sp. TP-A0874 TaxID=549819 RepID=UPI000852DB5E|nr:histidine kinase [Streptomyces sp. TP-A0874]
MTTAGETEAAGARPAPTGPWWWSRRRSMFLDLLLTVVSVLECAEQGLSFADEARIPVPVAVALGVLAGATMLLRRRLPVAVVLVSVAVTPAGMGFLLSVVGLYTLAASPEVPRRIIVLLTGMSLGGTLLVTSIRFDQGLQQEDLGTPAWASLPVSLLVSFGATAPPVFLGLYVAARRRLVESLRERADGLERELSLLAERAEERAEWARSEERTRIARDMHDVVAHRVSLMVVHATALQAVAVKDPDRAAKNAGLVADMGRQALTELREMLGVLRAKPGQDDPPGQAGAAVRSGGVPSSAQDPAAVPERPGAGAGGRTAPLPGARSPVGAVGSGAAPDGGRSAPVAEGPTLGELETLLDQSRTAGMSVELLVEGEGRSYPPSVEQTAYRVVQEALTNVHKHASGARTRVRVAHREAEIAVLVENEPSGGGSDAGLPSGGNGLLGMKERVAVLGGGFVYGPTESGGFRVSAVLPDRSR